MSDKKDKPYIANLVLKSDVYNLHSITTEATIENKFQICLSKLSSFETRNIALNIMQEVMGDVDYHNIPINNLRLRELIEWVRYIRDNYAGLIDFVPTPMLAYYGYLYDKYEYLERYLQDHEYYREYFISNFFNLSNINPILLTNHIFKNIPDIFKKRDIDIK